MWQEPVQMSWSDLEGDILITEATDMCHFKAMYYSNTGNRHMRLQIPKFYILLKNEM